MPIGPRGEKRPSNPNAAAIMVAKIATGEIEEEYDDKAVAKNRNIPLRAVKSDEKSDD